MRSFRIVIDVHSNQTENPFDMTVTRNIDVDNDRNLD